MTDLPDGRPAGAPGAGSKPAAGGQVEPGVADGAAAGPEARPLDPVVPVDPGTTAADTVRTGGLPAGLDPRGWRTTVAVAVLIVGIVGGANLVNAAVPLPTDPITPVVPGPAIPDPEPDPVDPGTGGQPPVDPGPVDPGSAVEVGHGLVLYPPAGWSVVASEPGQVALQKGGVVLVALATPYDGDPATLADTYAEAFFAGGQFQSSSPETGTLGDGVPAVVIAWSGIADGAQYDGVLAAGAASGTGMILNAIAPKGQFQGIAGDLGVIGDTLQITPGGN